MTKPDSIPTHDFLNSKRFAMKPLAAAVAAALFAQVSVAQDEQERVTLEEVIVTATKRELNLQDVGQSIMAYSTEDLKRMGVTSMEDVIRAMPSVGVQFTEPGRNSLTMRGVSEDYQNYYVDSQVSVYLDEQPMSTASQQVSVRAIDMERIEALPGPQGTLFGASSQTGTIRMITNKPNFKGFSGQVEAGYGVTQGGDGSYDVNGHLNMPLIDDVLSVRLVGYTSEDGKSVRVTRKIVGAKAIAAFEKEIEELLAARTAG